MKKDWLLFAAIVLLTGIGLATLYSTTIADENVISGGGIMNSQLIFVLIGITVYFLVTLFDYKYITYPQFFLPVYVLVLIGLILVLLVGVEVNYAKRWITFAGVGIQISEFAKLAVIIVTAGLFALRNRFNVWILAILSFLATMTMAGLVFVEPDASTAILICIIWFCMAYTALPGQARNLIFLILMILSALVLNSFLYGNMTAFVVLIGLCILTLIVSYFIFHKINFGFIAAVVIGLVIGIAGNLAWENILQDYQKQRIESFINPSEDVRGSGFQVAQSKVAIGSGMLFGKGFGQGTQSKLRFLPEHQTDFIFAAFAEEFGLIGAMFLLGIYAFTVFRIIKWANAIKCVFGSLVCIGVAGKFLSEIFINVGMNLGVVPATGIPLPLMSAGGSMLLATMICMGLVQSIVVHRDIVDTT
ncbi:MAG: FtsW/RodA/SpoVE family cell cycle protein [Patescibacteria group bacterium]|nr:FtsW/RodA/SpoVE family cell cycle protein [Patescibacteria group bacterium]